jgi:hypothetical protein
MVDVSTIERLPDESARAYRARVEYVTMGPDRSLEKTRQRLGKSAAGYTRVLEEWSSRYDWQATAQGWDNQQAAALESDRAEAYRAELADYRKRYGEIGKGLWRAAALITARLAKEANTIELTPNALTLASNAAKTAADLEALALRVEHLLGTMDEPRSE